MLDRLLQEIPRLTDAVARAEFDGEGSYDVTETGAADAVREVSRTAKRTARQGAGQAKRTARQARKVPGVARAEGTVKGAVASESDLAIANYDSLSADEIQDKLSELSQIDLAKVNAYERKNQNRSTITSRIDSLQADEPWPGYDELGVDEVRAVLSEGDETRSQGRPQPTSASTRTAPASSRPPSASSATPRRRATGRRKEGAPGKGPLLRPPARRDRTRDGPRGRGRQCVRPLRPGIRPLRRRVQLPALEALQPERLEQRLGRAVAICRPPACPIASVLKPWPESTIA